MSEQRNRGVKERPESRKQSSHKDSTLLALKKILRRRRLHPKSLLPVALKYTLGYHRHESCAFIYSNQQPALSQVTQNK